MITENDQGQLNAWAKEPTMYVDPTIQEQMNNNVYETHNEKAELLNARAAMLGIVAGFISYSLTGKLFFGIW